MSRPYYAKDHRWQDFIIHKEDIPFFQETVFETWIRSGNSHIHLDVYRHDKVAPTVIYCHGLSTCGRMMGHFARLLYDRGYNVICPDLTGFGMTLQKAGSGTIDDFLQNIFDVIRYVKKHYEGPRYIAGISMGGALSYYAAAAGADVHGIASLCLMDFSAKETLDLTIKDPFIRKLLPVVKPLSKILPALRLPVKQLLNIDALSRDEQVLHLFKNHPMIVKSYTMRAIHSFLYTPPQIPFEDFDRVPVLVLHAEDDDLIPEELSRSNYQKIKSLKKYVSLEGCGHVPHDESTFNNYINAMDDWFSSLQV